MNLSIPIIKPVTPVAKINSCPNTTSRKTFNTIFQPFRRFRMNPLNSQEHDVKITTMASHILTASKINCDNLKY